jgi:hypothetical protein
VLKSGRKKKKHNVFRPSEDIKEIMTEKFMRQKLNYMHKNPVSGKWKLAENYLYYIHSSARFYELGEEGVFHVYHYSIIPQSSRRSNSINIFRIIMTAGNSAETIGWVGVIVQTSPLPQIIIS